MGWPKTRERNTLPGLLSAGDAAASSAAIRKICIFIGTAMVPSAWADWTDGNHAALAVLAFQAVSILAVAVANHFGRMRVATGILCYSALAAATAFLLISTKGFYDPASLMYPLILVIAALLFSRWHFRLFTLVVGASIALVEALEYLGWARTAPEFRDLAVVDVAVISVIAAGVSAMLVEQLRRSLARSRQYGAAMQSLVSISTGPGDQFFHAAALELSKLLPPSTVVIGTFPASGQGRIQTLAVVDDGKPGPNREIEVAGTSLALEPGSTEEWVRVDGDRSRLPVGISTSSKIFSLCAPLRSPSGGVLGLMAILTETPLVLDTLGDSILSIFANSVAGILALRKETEALRESEDRFSKIVESDVVGVVVADETGILEASDYFLAMVEYTRGEFVAGKLPWDCIVPEDQCHVADAAMASLRKTGASPAYERRFAKRRGGNIPVLVGAVAIKSDPLVFLAFVIDLTRQKGLEKQFLQAQKLETVGILAGGIAHDFNNLITVIAGYSSILAARLPEGGRDRELAGRIHQTAESATNLTQQLLAFSRTNPTKAMRVRVNEVVLKSAEMIARLLGDSWRLETVLEANPDEVDADPTQIQQCLLNLTLNARDAMPGGGRIAIRTRNTLISPLAFPALEGPTGSCVAISVQDRGTGMDENTMARIFEPFFTTKPPGKGTGLGLSSAYGIVRRWGGGIKAESKVGFGSVFTITLPSAALPGSAEPENRATSPGAAVPGGRERILVVEDRDDVRAYVVQVLEDFGYNVLRASGGNEALEIMGRERVPVRLLLTDIVMHGMRGTELATAARRLDPALPVLFMTGHAAETSQAISDPQFQVIEKPFAPNELAARVRKILDGAQK